MDTDYATDVRKRLGADISYGCIWQIEYARATARVTTAQKDDYKHAFGNQTALDDRFISIPEICFCV
jgi:hypothetical protein